MTEKRKYKTKQFVKLKSGLTGIIYKVREESWGADYCMFTLHGNCCFKEDDVEKLIGENVDCKNFYGRKPRTINV